MAKILLRIVGILLVLHGSATFVAAKFLPVSAIGDRLLFAQHGFTFIFLALLNMVVWLLAFQSAVSRWSVHLSNLAFFLFYIAISVGKPEPPNIISTALIGALLGLGLMLDHANKMPNQVLQPAAATAVADLKR
jgi:hypothetical protein